MNDKSQSDVNLSPDENDMLSQVLELMEQLGNAVPALKFRAAHREQLGLLDSLEAAQWLKRDSDRYTVLSIILPLVNSDPARRLMAAIEPIYALLREKYIESQQDPVKVMDIAITTGLHGEQVLAILRLMMDCTVWNAGGSFDIGIEDAYVIPAEKIIEFESYASLAKEVRGWWILPVRESALEESTEDRFIGRDQSLGHNPLAAVHSLLTGLLPSITNQAQKVFLNETIACCTGRAYRAAIVMGWNLAYSHLCDRIFTSYLTAFNANRFKISSKLTDVAKRTDFQEYGERQVIDICKAAGIVDKSIYKILQERLDRRNMAAHPSSVIFTSSQAEDLITDLVYNVLLNSNV